VAYHHATIQPMQGMRIALVAVLCAQGFALPGAAVQVSRRAQERIDEALRRESEALVALADDAVAGRRVPTDFTLEWHNDFFKAQPGTFVPFTVSFDPPRLSARLALLYVRVERQGTGGRGPYAYETIFPVRVTPEGGRPVRLTRGFAVPPGRYRVVVVLRESPDEPTAARRAGVLLRALEAPDFWTGELATSTVMLAERLERLSAPVPPDQLDEDPYAVGSNRIHLAGSRSFGRKSELIVVFLIYNLSVGPNEQFDAQVDYHLYRKIAVGKGPPDRPGDHPPARPGERYVTRTNPQRFNPSMMGGQFDPTTGAPMLAGQGILLAEFEPGEYRLGITVTDLLSRRTLLQDVTFTVAGS
jgi:hypothetical protein